MRIALLTEGGYPYARGESAARCDRLLRGLAGHGFAVYALSRSARQEEAGWCALPGNAERVRTAPLWGPPPAEAGARGGGAGSGYGRRARSRFAEHFGALAEAVCTAGQETADGSQADRFAAGLCGLAELAHEHRGLPAALRSEEAVRLLEPACAAPGVPRAAHSVQVTQLLAVAQRLERALRPLSLDWYGCSEGPAPGSGSSPGSPGFRGARTRGNCAGHGGGGDEGWGEGAAGLAAADLCHAVGGGPAALPGLLAARAHGTPLLITEYGVRMREHHLAGIAAAADAVAPAAAGAPVRALLASFQRQLAHEAYAQAQLITLNNAHARRRQERCGARRDQLRTVHPGMDATPFTAVAAVAAVTEAGEAGEAVPGGRAPSGPTGSGRTADRAGALSGTLVRAEPGKDLVTLLHAFARVRGTVPGARLRTVRTAPGRDADADACAAHCRALAARLFPGAGACGPADAATDAPGEESPVPFTEVGSAEVPTLADACAGAAVVLSSVVEGLPVSLVEAMLCGRATVSTDVGAVCEVVGGTGLAVPPRAPRALADACVALLRDPARRMRLGAAARARALELFTVEQNVEAFRGICLELMSHSSMSGGGAPVGGTGGNGAPLPFARPVESHAPGRWAVTTHAPTPGPGPGGTAAGAGRRLAGLLAPRRSGARPGGAVRVPSWARPEAYEHECDHGDVPRAASAPAPAPASASVSAPGRGRGAGAGAADSDRRRAPRARQVRQAWREDPR